MNMLKYYYRLKTLIRYNNRPRITHESVAEHSYFVSLIALALYHKLKVQYKENVDLGELLTMCVIHDLPESKFSDIPYDAKKLLNIKNMHEHEMMFFNSGSIKNTFHAAYYSQRISSRLLDLADILSVKLYAEHEQSLGNTNFSDILEVTTNRIESLKPDCSKYFDEPIDKMELDL